MRWTAIRFRPKLRCRCSGTGERISALVTMNHPGVWVMGDLADDDRGHGMGIVVEYEKRASRSGSNRSPTRGTTRCLASQVHTPLHLMIRSKSRSSSTMARLVASICGCSTEKPFQWSPKPAYTVKQCGRYRAEISQRQRRHPRHSFELVRVGGKPTAGVIKDVGCWPVSGSWQFSTTTCIRASR